MDDGERPLAPACDQPHRLLTRHGLLPVHSVPAYAPVPAWEKRFVTDLCGIPWKWLLKAKKFMPAYKNIIDWNDSGARENFENEKEWFRAELNGLRCEIPPPAPDLYLEKVDYQEINLEKRPPQQQLRATPSYGRDSIFLSDTTQVTGWGDAEDPQQRNWVTPADQWIVPTGWEQSNSGYSLNYIAVGQNNNLLGVGQDWRYGKNDSRVNLVNKNNHDGSRNFSDKKMGGFQYSNRWSGSEYPGNSYHVNLRRNNGREGSGMGYAYDNQPLAMR